MAILHPDGWPWVRTQIHPAAHHAVWQVHYLTHWTMPQLYAAAIHRMFLGCDPVSVAADILDSLASPQNTQSIEGGR